MYRQLGFSGGAHAFNSECAIFDRGEVELHFFQQSQLVPCESCAGCYLRLEDVKRVYHTWQRVGLPQAGIPRVDRLEDKPWGMRAFTIVDPDGNLVRVGEVVNAQLNSPDAQGHSPAEIQATKDGIAGLEPIDD